jgi:hypothetical protein
MRALLWGFAVIVALCWLELQLAHIAMTNHHHWLKGALVAVDVALLLQQLPKFITRGAVSLLARRL